MSATESELQLQLHNKMVEELGERHREFKTLTDMLEEVVFRCDDNGELALLNAAWERKTGCPADSCKGRRLMEFLDAESAAWLLSGLAGGEPMAFDVRLMGRAGDHRLMSLRARRSANAWYGSLYDVTELRRTADALEASRDKERQLSLVASRTDNLVIISDAHGCIEWVNHSFEQVTGYSLGEVQGRRPGDFLQGEATDAATVAQMHRGLEEGTGFSVEVVNYSRAGEPYWLAIDCTPVLDDDGTIVNFIAIEREVSERKRSEQALLDSERHHRTILNTVSEAIFYCDSTLQLQFVNPAWSDMTGHCLGTGKSDSLLDYIHPEDIQRVLQARDRASGGESSVREELRLRDAGCDWRRVELVLSSNASLPSDTGSDLTGALVDIDDRWQATQTILRAKQEAEDLSRARTRFVANMSHEIRTPLNAIIGMTSVLQQTELNDEQRACLDTLCNGGKVLLALVNDVLDLSKLDSEEIQLECSEFDLADLCEEAINIVAAAVEEKGLVLSLTCDPGVPRLLFGDGHRIRQVLINLLSNAVKFTARGGIGLRVSWTPGTPQGELEFAVQDSGIGIPDDRIGQLFDAFSQADLSTTRRYGGTGLGLAICRQICNAMGGAIDAQSTPGSGSVFQVKLPLKARHEETPASLQRLRGLNLDTRTREVADSLAHCLGMKTEFDDEPGAEPGLTLVQENGDRVTRHPPFGGAVLTPNRLWQLLCPPVPEPSFSIAPGREASALRILIAEDVRANQMVIEAMLKMLGYQHITIVENGQLAVNEFGRQSFDLVLLDLHMPVMDGLEAAVQIRETPAGEKIRIVAVSADVTTDSRQATSHAGFDDWLPKPFTRDALESLMKKMAF
uniref:ATP-binding protein n=1 Tax=Marinobacterium profundum TaxID=1714300 RepID=UPI0008302936|nr:ATP-binding protein [Marinobacterium profundum]